MKERPIIFSSDSVKAIMEGRKTQTRRVITGKFVIEDPKKVWDAQDLITENKDKIKYIRCPYGKPGDRLWVRETWIAPGPAHTPFYKAYIPNVNIKIKWKSPIHMPRWASRITLEITDVRVERLQDITFHDLQAEAVGTQGELTKAMEEYIQIWDNLNSKRGYPWSSNPWVWCLTFKVTP